MRLNARFWQRIGWPSCVPIHTAGPSRRLVAQLHNGYPLWLRPFAVAAISLLSGQRAFSAERQSVTMSLTNSRSPSRRMSARVLSGKGDLRFSRSPQRGKKSCDFERAGKARNERSSRRLALRSFGPQRPLSPLVESSYLGRRAFEVNHLVRDRAQPVDDRPVVRSILPGSLRTCLAFCSLPSFALPMQARGGPDGIAASLGLGSGPWPGGLKWSRHRSRDKRTVSDTPTKKKDGMLTFRPFHERLPFSSAMPGSSKRCHLDVHFCSNICCRLSNLYRSAHVYVTGDRGLANANRAQQAGR